MTESKKGEVFSLARKREEKQAEEKKEFSNFDAAFIIKYIVDKYFSGENGQKKLMRVLEENVTDKQNREDILDFISDLILENSDEEVDEAEVMEEEFDLINMLGLAVGKTKEQIEEELAAAMHEVAEQLKKRTGGPSKLATVREFKK